MKRLAIDVGGTFTDFVLLAEDGAVTIEKAPSLLDRPDDVFFEGITRLGVDLATLETIIHGSTLVINTVVQARGAPVGLITTQGFCDVIELARGNRLDIYDLFYEQPEPLVPRYLRLEAIPPSNLSHLAHSGNGDSWSRPEPLSAAPKWPVTGRGGTDLRRCL